VTGRQAATAGRPRAPTDVLQLRPEAHARIRVPGGAARGDDGSARRRLGHGAARGAWLAVRALVFARTIYASLSSRRGEYWPAPGAGAAEVVVVGMVALAVLVGG
jgi:hypothetical protein